MRHQNQGMNWIRKDKRFAIYMRDGFACVYCGCDVEDVRLTLDHVYPVSKGGNNDADNLVTACVRCNSAKGDREAAYFVQAVAEYLDEDYGELHRFICDQLTRDISGFRAQAKEMLARRASFRVICLEACNGQAEGDSRDMFGGM